MKSWRSTSNVGLGRIWWWLGKTRDRIYPQRREANKLARGKMRIGLLSTGNVAVPCNFRGYFTEQGERERERGKGWLWPSLTVCDYRILIILHLFWFSLLFYFIFFNLILFFAAMAWSKQEDRQTTQAAKGRCSLRRSYTLLWSEILCCWSLQAHRGDYQVNYTYYTIYTRQLLVLSRFGFISRVCCWNGAQLFIQRRHPK